MNPVDGRLSFGPFELDPATLELKREGADVRLAPQPAKLLALLAMRHGEMVSHDEIREHVWGTVAVDFDSGLHTCIRQIRNALQDDPQQPRYIATIPRRGYRFIADVTGPSRDAGSGGRGLGAGRIAIVSVVVLLMLSLAFMVQRGDTPAGPTNPPRLVVLPFASLPSDGESAYLAAGLAEEIRTDLARIGPDRLSVIARVSSERYGGSGVSMDRIVSDLEVTHLLEGSLRQAPGGLVLSARLVRVDDETQVWAERFAVDPVQPSDPVAEIASRVTTALALKLDPTGRRPPATPVPAAARDAFLEARYLFHRDEAPAAEERLHTAIELAPEYAEAHGLLAEVLQAAARADEAERHAARSIELDPSLAVGYRVLGHVALARLNGTAAGRWYEEAVRAAPADPESRMAYGYWLLIAGRTDEGIAHFHEAVRRDPVSPLVRSDLPWSYFYARRLDEAASQAAKSLELLPDLLSSVSCRLWVAIARGDDAESRRRLQEFLVASGAPDEQLAEVKSLSDAASVRWYLERVLRARRAREPVSHSRLAVVYALLGDVPAALHELELSLDQREPNLVYFPIDPRFDAIRDDPQYAALVERYREVFWNGAGPHEPAAAGASVP